MRITFVEPRSALEGFSFGWHNKVPMIGIVYLATILKNKGHDVRIYKESVQSCDWSRHDTDVLCISIMTSTAKRGYKIASLFKENNPDSRVIIGGMHASAMPNEAAQHADHVIVGEAEEIIADAIEGRYKEKIIQGTRLENLDSIPFPDFSLIEGLNKLPYRPVSTSRGCPFNCTFCSVTPMFGRKYRFRSPEQVVEEVISNKQQKGIFFYDDNLFAMKDRGKKILQGLVDHKFNYKLMFQSRHDIVNDPELLKLLSKLNTEYAMIGLESLNQKTLEEYHKNQSVDNVKQSIQTLHDYNIPIHGMFVLGSDADDLDTIKKTAEFCKKTKIESPQFSILTPLPGTQTFSDLNAQGRILTKDWDYYDVAHAVFLPKKMTPYELQTQVHKQTRELYWITRRGIKFFFENVGSSVSILRNSFKWDKENRNYIDRLKEMVKNRKPLLKAGKLNI